MKYIICYYFRLGSQISAFLQNHVIGILQKLTNVLHKPSDVSVPSGSVKFSHSARLNDMTIRVCDSDFDIINIELSGLEVDVLFRANERFVFRTFLASISVDHLSDITLYPKVCYNILALMKRFNTNRNSNRIYFRKYMLP